MAALPETYSFYARFQNDSIKLNESNCKQREMVYFDLDKSFILCRSKLKKNPLPVHTIVFVKPDITFV